MRKILNQPTTSEARALVHGRIDEDRKMIERGDAIIRVLVPSGRHKRFACSMVYLENSPAEKSVVYALVDTADWKPFYIGKTKEFSVRMQNHCRSIPLDDGEGTALSWPGWKRVNARKIQIAEAGNSAVVVVINGGMEDDEAEKLERQLIASFDSSILNTIGTTSLDEKALAVRNLSIEDRRDIESGRFRPEFMEREGKLLKAARAAEIWFSSLVNEAQREGKISLNGPADHDLNELRRALGRYE